MKRFLLFSLLLAVGANLPLAAQDFFKTPSGKKYHSATCRMVRNVSEKVDASDIVRYGLKPCKICKPVTTGRPVSYGSTFNKAVGEGRGVRCHGITKRGTRCKHMTKLANGYCFQHKDQYHARSGVYQPRYGSVHRCGARTRSGGFCKRKVRGGGRCYQHRN